MMNLRIHPVIIKDFRLFISQQIIQGFGPGDRAGFKVPGNITHFGQSLGCNQPGFTVAEGFFRLPAGFDFTFRLKHFFLQLAHQTLAVKLENFLFRRWLRDRRAVSIPGSRHNLTDRCHEYFRLAGLENEAVGANLQGEFFIFWAGVGGGVKDERHAPQSIIRPDFSAQLKPVHHRHENVADDQIELTGFQSFKRLLTVYSRLYLMSVAHKQGFEEVAVFFLIVND